MVNPKPQQEATRKATNGACTAREARNFPSYFDDFWRQISDKDFTRIKAIDNQHKDVEAAWPLTMNHPSLLPGHSGGGVFDEASGALIATVVTANFSDEATSTAPPASKAPADKIEQLHKQWLDQCIAYNEEPNKWKRQRLVREAFDAELGPLLKPTQSGSPKPSRVGEVVNLGSSFAQSFFEEVRKAM